MPSREALAFDMYSMLVDTLGIADFQGSANKPESKEANATNSVFPLLKQTAVPRSHFQVYLPGTLEAFAIPVGST